MGRLSSKLLNILHLTAAWAKKIRPKESFLGSQGRRNPAFWEGFQLINIV